MNATGTKPDHRYTVAEYLTWTDEERWELIDGVAYNLSPAPAIKHQIIAGEIFVRLKEKLRGKPCQAFIAPVGVVLSDRDVVQPEIIVICDPIKITEKNIQGAPDLVVEVLSPGTATKDLREKKALYERTGVREYVLVDPLEDYVQAFRLNTNGQYGSASIYGPPRNPGFRQPGRIDDRPLGTIRLPGTGCSYTQRGTAHMSTLLFGLFQIHFKSLLCSGGFICSMAKKFGFAECKTVSLHRDVPHHD